MFHQSFVIQANLFPHLIQHTYECLTGVKCHHGTFRFPPPQQIAKMLDFINKTLSTVDEGE